MKTQIYLQYRDQKLQVVCLDMVYSVNTHFPLEERNNDCFLSKIDNDNK